MTDTVGSYRILDRIGSGGLGEVYRARDTEVGRVVALKIVSASIARDPDRRRDLLQAAALSAALSHPNVATLFEVGEEGPVVYLAFEHVAGESLRTIIGDRPINVRRAVDLAIQLGEALAEGHRWGVVHGDVKPGAVLVAQSGRAKLLDFGLSRWTRGGAVRRAAAEGLEVEPWTETVLTVAYMSPEQVLGGPSDDRTDIFSLGVMLYEMLTGENPFVRPTAGDTVVQILRVSPPPPSARTSAVPPELDAILGRALAKSLDLRYQSAAEMIVDLRGAAAALDAQPPERTAAPAAAPAGRPGPLTMIVLLIVLFLVGAGAAWFWMEDLRRLLAGR